MKSLIVFALTIVLANALDQEFIDKFMEKLQEIGQVCAEETHATDEDISELIAHKLPPTSHEAKCMIFCFNKHFEIQNDDGSLNKAGAVMALDELKRADPEMHRKLLMVFITCGEKAEINSDPCVTATNLAICGRAEAKAVGLDESLLA